MGGLSNVLAEMKRRAKWYVSRSFTACRPGIGYLNMPVMPSTVSCSIGMTSLPEPGSGWGHHTWKRRHWAVTGGCTGAYLRRLRLPKVLIIAGAALCRPHGDVACVDARWEPKNPEWGSRGGRGEGSATCNQLNGFVVPSILARNRDFRRTVQSAEKHFKLSGASDRFRRFKRCPIWRRSNGVEICSSRSPRVRDTVRRLRPNYLVDPTRQVLVPEVCQE